MELSTEELLEKKKILVLERDEMAVLYAEYLKGMVDNGHDPVKFDYFENLVKGIEPRAKQNKEEIREINRILHSRNIPY